MPNRCVACNKNVRRQQHSLVCKSCRQYQHRLCGTGISIKHYRAFCKGELTFNFYCSNCKTYDRSSDFQGSLDGLTEPSSDQEYSEPQNQFNMASLLLSPRSSTLIEDDSNLLHPRSPPNPADRMESLSNSNVLLNTFTIGRPIDDLSFDVSVDITPRLVFEESDVEEMVEDDSLLEEQPVSYEIIEGGSIRMAKKLVSSDGFSYTIKKSTGCSTYWRCSIRNASLWCKATVTQRGELFVPGTNPHQHVADPGLVKKIKINVEVLRTAATNSYRSASDIVEEKMRDEIKQSDFNIPKPSYLVRSANRLRQKMRPSEPKDLSFDIDHIYLEDSDFFRGDLHVDEARHIIFASTTQLTLLESARRWYLDGTFKVVGPPFIQLFSIHAFLQKEDSIKQVPLLFALMSRRQKKDYDAVFQRVKTLLPAARVESFTMDFEAATWRSIQDIFPEAEIQGCAFHWSQAVMRKVANLGLRPTYNRRQHTHHFIRRLLSLPYLPATHILPAFNTLRDHANSDQLKELMNYISSTWMRSNIWNISQWSVFRQPVRTNNDTEGWHRRFAGKAGGTQLQFYRLVPALKREADSVTIFMKLVQEQQLTRYQRETYRKAQGRLFNLWDQYEARQITTSAFLASAGKLFA